MGNKTQKAYLVRTGAHKGQYIGIRIRSGSTKKYCWVNTKSDAQPLSLNQAKAIVRNYGGELYSIEA